MATEVEFKAWAHDPAGLETRLAAHATFAGEVARHDIYFRRPEGPSGHIRLRREGQTATVTTKHKRRVGGMEINQEIEFEISDAQAFCRLLDRFGFEPFAVKNKLSRVYRAESASRTVTLELNEVEHLGTFVEIEIMCGDDSQAEAARRELAEWAERLDIPQDSIEPTPYLRLIAERHPARYRFDHGDPVGLVREVALDGGHQERLL